METVQFLFLALAAILTGYLFSIAAMKKRLPNWKVPAEPSPDVSNTANTTVEPPVSVPIYRQSAAAASGIRRMAARESLWQRHPLALTALALIGLFTITTLMLYTLSAKNIFASVVSNARQENQNSYSTPEEAYLRAYSGKILLSVEGNSTAMLVVDEGSGPELCPVTGTSGHWKPPYDISFSSVRSQASPSDVSIFRVCEEYYFLARTSASGKMSAPVVISDNTSFYGLRVGDEYWTLGCIGTLPSPYRVTVEGVHYRYTDQKWQWGEAADAAD